MKAIIKQLKISWNDSQWIDEEERGLWIRSGGNRHTFLFIYTKVGLNLDFTSLKGPQKWVFLSQKLARNSLYIDDKSTLFKVVILTRRKE